MNCKPGDLAVIVGGFPENLGKVVTVLEKYVAPAPFVLVGNWWLVRPLSPCLNLCGEFVMGDGSISDDNLRPLRDNDGQDETLNWACLPKPVYLPAPEWVK